MGILDAIDKISKTSLVENTLRSHHAMSGSISERFDTDSFVEENYSPVLHMLQARRREGKIEVMDGQEELKKILRSIINSVDVKSIEISKLSADEWSKVSRLLDAIRNRQEPLNPFDSDGQLSQVGLREFYRKRIRLAAQEVGVGINTQQGKEVVNQLAGQYADRLLETLGSEDLDSARKLAGEFYPTEAIPAAVEALPEADDLVAWVEEFYGIWVKLELMDTGEIDRLHPVSSSETLLSRRIGIQLRNRSKSKAPPCYDFAIKNPPKGIGDVFPPIRLAQEIRLNAVPAFRLGDEYGRLSHRVTDQKRKAAWRKQSNR